MVKKSRERAPSLIRASTGLLLALALAGCFSNPARIPVRASASGLQTANGQPLYTYRGDVSDVKEGGLWLPFPAHADDVSGDDFSVIGRSDGRYQWAYHGAPMYYYAGGDDERSRDPDLTSGRWRPVPASSGGKGAVSGARGG